MHENALWKFQIILYGLLSVFNTALLEDKLKQIRTGPYKTLWKNSIRANFVMKADKILR